MNEIKQLSRRTKVIIGLITIVAIAGIATSGVLWNKMRNLENPNLVADKQLKETVADVGKVLVLPTDETPTMATVADPAKLADQPFFAHAAAGDVVLIYQNNKRAILWRPSTKQVVEVSPLNIPAASSTGQ